jgi:gp16 family phage-associated protein
MKQTKPRQQPVAATRTPAEAKAEFARKGMSIRAWALKHELPPTLVYEILRGNERRRCLRGASHRAAVLLGIKEGELAEAA